MTLACQDFEKIAKAERDEEELATKPSSIDDAFKTPAPKEKRSELAQRRFAKAASKTSEGSCMSFDAYCQQSSNSSEHEMANHLLESQEPLEVQIPTIDIDSLMKKVPATAHLKRRKSKLVHSQESTTLARKRNSPATPTEELKSSDNNKRVCCSFDGVSKFM